MNYDNHLTPLQKKQLSSIKILTTKLKSVEPNDGTHDDPVISFLDEARMQIYSDVEVQHGLNLILAAETIMSYIEEEVDQMKPFEYDVIATACKLVSLAGRRYAKQQGQ